ncbi:MULTISPECIES: sugar phosphate isomerase/epimerase [unclassified Frondihabitans]|uniref:sugar phosphate isomerase/epimerase family protein n=1 Tax=unclassified Frondihabitans TaxID=2626248 RepID=UPI000F4DE08B|nr:MULTISPECIES: sugar phosphate isomerase/epimerase [unclassified Frondihabitans]RPE76271.1 2-keto-myo-inositol dehydratase [Frondihabitans sp. PhB153]RPF05453.1 2-keto-myo-inositol dehydratase [Frondihabitans sp. PhB161]
MTVTSTTVDRGIRIGTAPDSWGVWFAEHPSQIPWDRFLDEVEKAGYEWIELGPFGYLPTDPHQLEDELGKRGLKLSAGTVFTGLHKGDDQWQRAWDQALNVAGLASKLGAEHLVVIPDLWRSDLDASVIESRTLTTEQWGKLGAGHDKLGKALLEEFGVKQQFHTHADSHVGTYQETERFLEVTDQQFTNLCLDTGHFAYYGGDNVRLIEQYPDRIGYLHLKQVDSDLRFTVLKNDIPFGDAVAMGVMVEPPTGVPEFAPIIEAVAKIDPTIFGIVEQDMFPVSSIDLPLGIATRTREHIFGCTSAARIH